jgi:lipoyl(octanoyl) transferase
MLDPAIVWETAPGLTAYPDALAAMEARVAAIHAGTAGELIWLVEHPPLYTAGTSADPAELLAANRFPVFTAGRGGRYTYHGPGQRVGYLMLDLNRRGRDLRKLICALEHWLINVLGEFAVIGRIIPGQVGVWVDTPRGPEKIAAIGVRIKRWVSFHGFALNIHPELDHFDGIIPCGIATHGVTSLAALNKNASFYDVDQALIAHFPRFLAELGVNNTIA